MFWGDPFWEANLDHTDNKCVPMQRETRFSYLQSAPMQRGAHFFLTKLRSHAGGVRFSSDRPHLVGLDWSVWTGLSGPVCLDPVCLDPVCLDSVCLDPVCVALFNLFSRALLTTTRVEAPPPHSYPHLRGVLVYERLRIPSTSSPSLGLATIQYISKCNRRNGFLMCFAYVPKKQWKTSDFHLILYLS